MNCVIDNSTTAMVCHFNGELTFEDDQEFRGLLQTVKDTENKTVTFDLQRLEYIDSAGLGMLLCASSDLETMGKSFSISQPNGQVLALLELSAVKNLIKSQ